MAGIEVLEQRARNRKNGGGEQTNKTDMDGCGRSERAGVGQAERLREGPDEDRGVSIRGHRQRSYGSKRVRGEKDWRTAPVSSAITP